MIYPTESPGLSNWITRVVSLNIFIGIFLTHLYGWVLRLGRCLGLPLLNHLHVWSWEITWNEIAYAKDSTHPDLKICSQPEIEYWKIKSIDFKKFHPMWQVPPGSSKSVGKLCRFSPCKPTKRQTFYIFGRSRYGLISIISGISLGRVRSLPCHTQRFSAREIPCFPSWHLSEMITKSLSRVFWTKCEISHPKGGKLGIHGWFWGMAGFGGWWNFVEFFRSHRIHVWYVYLHFADVYGKCR